MTEKLWLAFTLMLVFEGLFPFISPTQWRALFAKILRLSDGQIRFYGLCSMAIGVILLAFVW
jgi:uncharacterized protein